MNLTQKYQPITLRKQISSRGGGIEISLDTFGYEGEKMTAYQNYLGGGMTGSIANDCTVQGWAEDKMLVQIAGELARYYYQLYAGEEVNEESFLDIQKLPNSSY